MYLALLRGINVGGHNVIRMSDLRDAFEGMGFSDVATYIQSGNVLFRAPSRNSAAALTTKIESDLSDQFGYHARVVLRSKRQYMEALKRAPATWGTDPTRKHNALFTLPRIKPQTILAEAGPLVAELEEATCAPGVIFWSASAKSSRTAMMQVAKSPVYKDLTVRNHKTTFKLQQMLESA